MATEVPNYTLLQIFPMESKCQVLKAQVDQNIVPPLQGRAAKWKRQIGKQEV